MSGAETPVSRPCNACVESQSEQQRQAEENVRELAKQSAQYENQLRLNRQKISNHHSVYGDVESVDLK